MRHWDRPYPDRGGGSHRGMWHMMMRGMMWRGRGRGWGRGGHHHPPWADAEGGGWDSKVKCPVCGEFVLQFLKKYC